MLNVPRLNPDGTWGVNPDFKEIHILRGMLFTAGIPHEFARNFDGCQIGYPALDPIEERVCSVVETAISYGHEADLLEIMGLLTPEEEENDSVSGWLTAENVFGRIKAHWEAKNHASLE